MAGQFFGRFCGQGPIVERLGQPAVTVGLQAIFLAEMAVFGYYKVQVQCFGVHAGDGGPSSAYVASEETRNG